MRSSSRWPTRHALAFGVLATLTFGAPSAMALQPLDAFLASARGRNFDRREALQVVEQRDKDSDGAWRKLLPVVGARGAYTYNQYEAKAALPQADGTRLEAVITPQNQLDGYLTVDVPIVDLSAWSKIGLQTSLRDAAQARLEATSLDVEKQVARAFYQVHAQRAVLAAAERTLDTSVSNLRTIELRLAAGLATELDLARARAEVERNKQSSANATYNVIVTERQLATLSGLVPEPGGGLPDDDLHEEAPLASFEGKKTPSVVAAEREAKAQDHAVAQTKNLLLPTLSGVAQERFTNATGFANKSAIFTATLNLTWRLDLAVLSQADSQRAALAVNEVKTSRAERAQADDLYTGWSYVVAEIAACRAARAEAEANRLAATLAKEKYGAGTALQLDVLQADRQAFQSEVASIQADADLKYARSALRLAAGRSLTGDRP
jgi:outer membrane protein TolC